VCSTENSPGFDGSERAKFRIVYEVIGKELTVLIVRIGDRREVYRKKG